MPPPDQPFTRENIANFLLGIVNAGVFAGLAGTVASILDAEPRFAEMAAWIVCLLPVAMGFVAALTWSNRRYSDHALAIGALLTTLLAIGIAAAFLRDIWMPILAGGTFGYVCVLCGMIAGRHLCRRKP